MGVTVPAQRGLSQYFEYSTALVFLLFAEFSWNGHYWNLLHAQFYYSHVQECYLHNKQYYLYFLSVLYYSLEETNEVIQQFIDILYLIWNFNLCQTISS